MDAAQQATVNARIEIRIKARRPAAAAPLSASSVPRSLGSLRVSPALVLALAIFCAPQVHAQNPQYNSGAFPRIQMPDSAPPLAPDTGSPGLDAKRLEALNASRQKSLVSDTQKLVKLTAELNAQINGAAPASLTEDQLRMVTEIEKLAHSIREKMCTSVKGVPQFSMPGPSLMLPPLQ